MVASAVMSTMAAAVLLSSAASMPPIFATKRSMHGDCAMRASPKSRTGKWPNGVPGRKGEIELGSSTDYRQTYTVVV